MKAEADRLYEAFVRPLEADHWGEFVALTADGRMILGSDMDQVAVEAVEALGKGVFVFKIGPRAVGRLGLGLSNAYLE